MQLIFRDLYLLFILEHVIFWIMPWNLSATYEKKTYKLTAQGGDQSPVSTTDPTRWNWYLNYPALPPWPCFHSNIDECAHLVGPLITQAGVIYHVAKACFVFPSRHRDSCLTKYNMSGLHLIILTSCNFQISSSELAFTGADKSLYTELCFWMSSWGLGSKDTGIIAANSFYNFALRFIISAPRIFK